jgi:transcriptional regulator with XRE-family HTH domain
MLRAEGMTYEQIAKRFRITRGRAHQIVNGIKT